MALNSWARGGLDILGSADGSVGFRGDFLTSPEVLTSPERTRSQNRTSPDRLSTDNDEDFDGHYHGLQNTFCAWKATEEAATDSSFVQHSGCKQSAVTKKWYYYCNYRISLITSRP